jgi:4-hydroxybenzoate polyprenyltransferase
MAAGGYIINDYYDVEIDRINKPEKLIVGQLIKPSVALKLYWLLSVLGLLMGLWSSYVIGDPLLGIIFLAYFIGLWFYSKKLKYKPVIGNLLIAIFIAIVPYASGVFHLSAITCVGMGKDMPLSIKYWIWGISVFAFLTTLAREIVKDMEDVKGDSAAGCKTLPIVFGQRTAKRIVQVILLVLILALVYAEFWMFTDNKMDINNHNNPVASSIYIGLFLQLPLGYLIYRINGAEETKDLNKISNWLKVIMALGVTYLGVFHFLSIE